MEFIKTNPNPTGKKTGDCVVRAIAVATGRPWHNVYDELCLIGRAACKMPNNKDVYEALLLGNGWVKQRMPRKPNGKRYKLKEWAEENPKGIMVVNVVSHVACVRNGNLYDLWDCSKKCVGNYYTKQN